MYVQPGDSGFLQMAPRPAVEPSWTVALQLPTLLRFGGQDRRRTVICASREGVFVDSPDHASLGDLVQLVLLAGDGGPLRVLASVERIVLAEEAAFCGGPPGMGLRFVLLDRRLAERWGEFLDAVRERGAEPSLSPPDAVEHARPVPMQLTRREHTRRDIALRVTLRHGDTDVVRWTRDVSHGGLFLSLPDPPEPGHDVELHVRHPVSGRTLRMRGVVRWRRADGPAALRGAGIAFVGESDEAFLRFVNQG
jgi:hypothetical protein